MRKKYDKVAQISTKGRKMQKDFEKKLRKYIEEHPKKTIVQIAKEFNENYTLIGHAIKLFNIPYISKTRKLDLSLNDVIEYIKATPFATISTIASHFKCEPSFISMLFSRSGMSFKKYKEEIQKKCIEKGGLRIIPPPCEVVVHSTVTPVSEAVNENFVICNKCNTPLRNPKKITKSEYYQEIGRMGGKASTDKLTPEERKARAKNASTARVEKLKKEKVKDYFSFIKGLK
jgi:hypothetical protein